MSLAKTIKFLRMAKTPSLTLKMKWKNHHPPCLIVNSLSQQRVPLQQIQSSFHYPVSQQPVVSLTSLALSKTALISMAT